MYRSIFFVLIILLTITDVFSRPRSVYDIPVTRDLTGAPHVSRDQWLARHPEIPFHVYNVDRREVRRDENGTVVLAVNHSLLDTLSQEFDQYIADMSNDGYEVVLLDVEGGSAQDLKNLIIEQGGDDIVGLILAGDLPFAWYEHKEHFYSEYEADNNRVIDYPIDLFFMDLDGEWQDTTANGIYDWHRGDKNPEVWFGRIPGFDLTRVNEIDLLRAYFNRVHAYKTDHLDVPHKVLSFTDDDWIPWAEDWSEAMRLAYGNIKEVADPETTSAVEYKREMEEEIYEMLQVCVHSGTEAHLFRVNDHRDYDYFRFSHLRDDTEPNVLFYNLFACSNLNYSRELCMGSLYMLKDPTLGVVGSTKTGGMLYFEDFYIHLGEGLSFGEAFLRWFTAHGWEAGHQNWCRSWFYGMTYFGDPTLKIRRGLRSTEILVEDDASGDSDGFADAGETINTMIEISNLSNRSISNIRHVVETTDPYIEVLDQGHIAVMVIESQSSRFIESAQLRISGDCPDGHVANLTVVLDANNEMEWRDKIKLNIFSPLLTPIEFNFSERTGDGDLWVEPGEHGLLNLSLKNIGRDDMRRNGRITLTGLDNHFIPQDDAAHLNPIPAGEIGSIISFPFRISANADELSGAIVKLDVFDNDILTGTGILIMPVSENLVFIDDFNENPPWLRHYPVTADFEDVWRWDESSGDGNGGLSFGGPDTNLYPAGSDAAIELPLMMVDDDAILILRHRMDAETQYDGGIVEVDRGAGWQRVRPEGGYNGNSIENGSYAGGACWNGSFGWITSRIPLGGPAGSLRTRLRFSADGAVNGGGWHIDRIQLQATPLDVQDNPTQPSDFVLISAFPNPFNSQLKIQFNLVTNQSIDLGLYTVDGKLVDAISSGNHKAGAHTIVWNSAGLPSGIYVLKFNDGISTTSSKVVLLR